MVTQCLMNNERALKPTKAEKERGVEGVKSVITLV